MSGEFNKCNFCKVKNFRGIAICIDMRYEGKCPDIKQELVTNKAKEMRISEEEVLFQIR